MKLSNSRVALAGLAAVLAVSYYYFGFAGVRTLGAMLLFFFLPFFLILRNFRFDADEQAFFAFFMGIGLFSMAVFYFGRLIPSYRISIILAFIFLLAIAFALKKIKNRRKFLENSTPEKRSE